MFLQGRYLIKMNKITILRKLSMLAILSFISFGCTSVSHFNDLAESEERESGDVIPYLELKSGDRVADLGAGGGEILLLSLQKRLARRGSYTQSTLIMRVSYISVSVRVKQT